MKKTISVVLIFSLCFSFAACGAKNSQNYDLSDLNNDSNYTQSHENNGGDSSEYQQEDLDTDIVLADAGEYYFYNESANAYLSCNNDILTLSSTPHKWSLEETNENDFYICAENTSLVLDIDNAIVANGTQIKVWPKTGYDVQIWNICKTSSGKYSILYSGNNSFCLGLENGKTVLQTINNNDAQEWDIICVTKPKQKYTSYISKNGIIELRLPLDILNTIKENRLKQWADNLETAYYSYCELTNFTPYEKIIVKAYEPSEYIGWVTDNSNIIHIDNKFIYEDLEKMAARKDDWNFCALHEMGHMFDCGRPWNFEAELMTDLKLAYVLEQNNSAAAPSEFQASDIFYGKNIINAYEVLGTDFSNDYDIYACAERFLEIKNDIGWEPFKKTFHFLQDNAYLYSAYTKQEQFYKFIELLTEYSGKDIRNYFSTSEWNVIVNKCN